MTDVEVLSDEFLKHASLVFKALHPFGQFLNRGAD